MSFHYIKENKGRNIGVFVPADANEEHLANLEKVEAEDESLEDWHNIIVNEQAEGCDPKPSDDKNEREGSIN